MNLQDLLERGYIETDSTVGDTLVYPAEGYQVYIDSSVMEYGSLNDTDITIYDAYEYVICDVADLKEPLPITHVFKITKTKVF